MTMIVLMGEEKNTSIVVQFAMKGFKQRLFIGDQYEHPQTKLNLKPIHSRKEPTYF